ncbi:LOW QUALITY PROTEIN: SUN domain-containing protein 2-like [Syngnathus typhle]|uniref:LOW QUALITY PROTEIN: SUN domain-containing protein 2-like n=1 Tax=Syngnathus typhle TaxID=161592 RepID=UPI002A6A8D63|nr:LOW QUALITY PROTEIN: SUN domain-containing protein 2-like [Syngnathus typhle]
MSRRSQRLDNSLLDCRLPLGSASLNMGGNAWRNARMLKSHRPLQQSASCSESLLSSTPRKSSNQSLHGDITDASLLSSLLDKSSFHEASMQESTGADNFWEGTIMEEQNSTMADSVLIGSDIRCHPKHSVQTPTRVSYKDGNCGVSEHSTSNVLYAAAHSSVPEASTIYCKERRQPFRTARTDHGGNMSAKQRELHPNGSLCDDCKEKQHAEQTRVDDGGSPWSARARAFCHLMWNITVFTGRSSNLGGVLKWISRLGDGPMLTRLPLALLFVFVIPFSLCWFALDSLPALSISDSPTPTPALSQEVSLTFLDHVATPGQISLSQAADGEPLILSQQVAESIRLAHLERSLALLWERVEAGDQRAEQRHGEMIRMHTQLRHNDQSGKMWLSRLVERQMAQLRRQMNDHKQQREQELIWLQSQMSRLDLVEVNLQKLEAQEEVGRLEVMLRDIRRDVDALLGCQQLDQETISAQVQQGVRTVLFGNEWSESGFPDLRASLASLERSVLHNISHHLDQRRREEALTREDVNLMVKNALRLFSYDRTGLADYALESGGGSILSTRCSETYETKAALLSLFGVPLWYFSQSPRVVIQPNVHPGNCWAFRGSAGFLVIRLSMSILPTAFSLEHIPKALAPSGTLRSAPRDFQVYGLDDASQERGTLLGSYTYQEDGEAVQTYHVTEENDRAFQIIEVQVLSNWGHQEYTCMYRFRVHGTPQDT